MNNKGFSLIEVLAVLVILGILGTSVAIGVTKYRNEVDKKEIINLHSTISAGFDNYRSNQLIQGNSVSEIKFCPDGNTSKPFIDVSYSGKKLTCNDIDSNSKVEIKIKGDLLGISQYSNGKSETDFINDGTCLIEAKMEDGKFIKNCKKDSSGNISPSLEEITCIYLKANGKEIIDDYDTNSNNFCHYFSR